MTGLLRSLGAQALDHVPALRPAARLRSAEMSWVDRERERVSASETQAFEDAASEAPSAHGTAKPVSSVRAKPARPALEHDAAHDRGQRQRAITTIATGDAGSARGALQQSRITHDSERRTLDAPDDDEAAGERAPRIAPPERNPAAATTATSTSAKPARRRDHRARFEDPVALARPMREPALPDVQIHIGRIELTAVTAPASAPRAAPQGRKPMSLDDYLRERKRKTS